MESKSPDNRKQSSRRPMRAKLIFNPSSGQPGDSPQQLADILSAMQEQQILSEVHIVNPAKPLDKVVNDAIKSGIKLIVVAGGDGTIDSAMGSMLGSNATLGIIPTGTRNNVAFNLGITGDIASSVALLRQGRRLKIDVGLAQIGRARRWFLEVVMLGLISDLYPMADDIQHGNLAQIGGFLSTLVSATPSNLKIILDGDETLDTSAHMMIVTNMPFVGPRFQLSPDISFRDGILDVFTFPADMSKINMLTYAMLSRGGLVGDPGTKHYRVKSVKVVSTPHMPVLADGILLGHGVLSVQVHPRLLSVIAGSELTGPDYARAASNE